MKKFRSRIAIVLTMMLLFTSFEFVGVFADTPEGEAPVVSEESATEEALAPVEDVNVNQEAANDDNLQEDGEEPPVEPSVTEDDLKIEDMRLLSGFNCVVLRWKKIDVEGVEYYIDGNKVSVSAYNYMPGRLSGDYVMCKISMPVSEGAALTQQNFTLQAKMGDVAGPAVTSNRAGPVRTIAYTFTVKKGTTLRRHGGNGPVSYNLRKGETITAYGFGGGGCYLFKYRGSIFYVAKIRARKPRAVFTTAFNYTPEEAELFVNQKRVGSGSNVYLWCNSYTQHFYYMQGSWGNWRCVDDWECSTGKPSAPTPTGITGLKSITGKWKKHHNIKWWSKFSGTNSVHGQKKGWTFGRPKSNGCIRNPVAKAEKVYYGARVGTGLLVF